jgi:integrase/recombinase XerC
MAFALNPSSSSFHHVSMSSPSTYAVPVPFGDEGLPHARNRRFNLTPIPLQFSTLLHVDDEMRRVAERATAVEGLSSKTVAWMRDGYRSFRAFLHQDAARERDFLGGNSVQQVALIEAWVAWLRDRGRARSTVVAYWRGLDALFRRLEEVRGMFNPLATLRPPKAAPPLPRALTRSAAEKLMHHARNYPWPSSFEKHRNLAVLGLMLFAGLRRGEVLRLTMDDVDLDAGTIRIVRGKGKHGGKDRTAYPSPQLGHILSDYLVARRRARKTHAGFISSADGNRGIGEKTIRRLFHLLSRELEFHVTPHMLRHTYATLLRQSGVADRVAQELLGHSSLTMLQRYSRVFEGEYATEVARVHLNF